MPPHRIGSILVATDLGEGSEAVVDTAATLASPAKVELHLLHSLELPWVPAEDVMRRAGFHGHIERAEERLEAQAARLRANGLEPATQTVIIYVAHQAILDRAEEVEADLIVLGSHRGARTPRFLGTTADRVARSASVPTLVVGEPAAFPVGTVAVLTDLSAAARQTLETTVAWIDTLAQPREAADGGGREIRVVHVAHPLILAGDPDLAADIRRQLDRQIQEIPVAEDPERRVTLRAELLWDEKSVEAVERWVRDQEIGLLVLGTHGGGVVRRALLGSMAYSMARTTPCPVLLVPAPAAESARGEGPGSSSASA